MSSNKYGQVSGDKYTLSPTEIRIAPKRMHTLTFNKHKKQKFCQNLNLIFLPHPPLEGGTKKMKKIKSGRRA